MSSAISLELDQSKILSPGNGYRQISLFEPHVIYFLLLLLILIIPKVWILLPAFKNIFGKGDHNVTLPFHTMFYPFKDKYHNPRHIILH